jgi:hypothetical protein
MSSPDRGDAQAPRTPSSLSEVRGLLLGQSAGHSTSAMSSIAKSLFSAAMFKATIDKVAVVAVAE